MSSGQSWCPIGAEWHHSFSDPFGSVGYVHTVYTGDTIIMGHDCRIMTKRGHAYSYQTSAFYEYDEGIELTAAEDSVVLIFDPWHERFDTLFDLAASIGDRWRMSPRPSYMCDTNSFVLVIDTSHLAVDGYWLKSLVVEDHFVFGWSDDIVLVDTIVERIGSISWYLLPVDPCAGMTDGNEGGPFRCYRDHELSFGTGDAPACDNITGLGDPVEREVLSLQPNPGKDRVRISGSSHGERVEFFDPMGRPVLTGQLSLGCGELDTGPLTPGAYVVVLSKAGIPLGRTQWLKQ